MIFNSDRLSRLSGLTSRDDYRETILKEHGHQGYDQREDESLGHRRGPERDFSQSEKARRDDSYGKWGKRGHEHPGQHIDKGMHEEDEVDELDELEEAKIRKAIRQEVRAVLHDVLAERDERDIEHARKTHSVAASMGFGGTVHGKLPTRKNNRAAARGVGGTRGFGGPGFM